MCSEQDKAFVAQSMFKRVTRSRRGLLASYSIRTMLAFLAAQQFLEENGLSKYAEMIYRFWLNSGPDLDIVVFRGLNRKHELLWWMGFRKPIGLKATIARIDYEIDTIVSWPDICAMVRCKTWDEWLSRFPPDLRKQLKSILEL